jgi:hypothetical protein
MFVVFFFEGWFFSFCALVGEFCDFSFLATGDTFPCPKSVMMIPEEKVRTDKHRLAKLLKNPCICQWHFYFLWQKTSVAGGKPRCSNHDIDAGPFMVETPCSFCQGLLCYNQYRDASHQCGWRCPAATLANFTPGSTGEDYKVE